MANSVDNYVLYGVDSLYLVKPIYMRYLILTLALFACNKNEQTLVNNDNMFRLKIVDADSNVLISSVSSISNEQVGQSSSDENFCESHPNNPRCTSLPIKLEYFVATQGNGKVTANWKTTQEDNVVEFIVQSSSDGINYTDRAHVSPAGPSDYQVKIKR